MILRRRLHAHANRDPTDIYTTLTDAENFFRSKDGDSVNSGNAMRLSAVAAAHRIYCNSLSVLPWMIRKKVNGIREDADGIPLGLILKGRYNDFMGQLTAERAILSSAFWYGTGYGAIIRDRFGAVKEIFPLPGDCANRQVNPSDGSVWYTFDVGSDRPGYQKVQRKFQESELLIFRFESSDGYTGRGILDIARDSISADSAAQKYSKKFFTNGSRPSGIVKVKTNLAPEAREIVQGDFERMARGLDNAFRVAVLDNGMEYTPLGISQRDAQFIEGRQFSVEEVSRFTGIPAYMLQTGKQSYQSNEQQMLDFCVNTLTPPVTQMEQEWAYKLLTDSQRAEGYYLKKNINAMLRGTPEQRAQFYEKLISMSMMNADEGRELEDMNPLPNGLGQIYRFSRNYADVRENTTGGEG